MKTCPQCKSIVPISVTMCPDCQFDFPPPQKQKIDDKPSEKSVLSDVKDVVLERYEVKEIIYSVHVKRNADPHTPRTMRVSYVIGNTMEFSEWVCVEHENFAREKAVKWWQERTTLEMPYTAEAAVELANQGYLAFAEKIIIKNDGSKFPQIVDYELCGIPSMESIPVFNDEDVPF